MGIPRAGDRRRRHGRQPRRTNPISRRPWRRPPRASTSTSPGPRASSSPRWSTCSRSASDCRATGPAARWNPSCGCRGRRRRWRGHRRSPDAAPGHEGERPCRRGQRPQQLHRARTNDTEPQPLSMLLPAQRDDYAFDLGGPRHHRQARRRPAGRLPPGQGHGDGRRAAGRGATTTASATTSTGGLRGRLWIDAETSDVLRLDQRLGGQVGVPCRASSRAGRASPRLDGRALRHDLPLQARDLRRSARDARAAGVDDDAALTRGAGTPRTRMTTAYPRYHRFLTGGRIIPTPQDRD